MKAYSIISKPRNITRAAWTMPVTTIPHQDRQQPRHQSSSNGERPSSSGPYTASQYIRNPDYIAKTQHSQPEDNYILTLHTDAVHHKTMTALRNRHFPPHINKLAAHIALFRALPGSKLSAVIIPDLEHLTSTQQPFTITASTPFRLRQGVAVSLERPGANAASSLHRELKGRWAEFLSKQDGGGFQAHYTIQNKVDDEQKVEETMDLVKKEFQGSQGTVNGLTLWKYDRGYWRKERDFVFSSGGNDAKSGDVKETRS